MKFIKILKKSILMLVFFYVGILSSQIIEETCNSCECEEPINVWFKVSTDQATYGQIVKLDMSKGKSFTDGQYIYLIVNDLSTNEQVIVAFPYMGDWVSQEYDPFIDALEKEFKSLEDYLRSNEDKSSEIKKKQ